MNSTHKHFITLLFLCISLFMPFSAGAQVNNNKKQTKKVHSSVRKKPDVPDEDRHFTAGDAEYIRAVAPGVRVTFDKYNTDSLPDETITVNGVRLCDERRSRRSIHNGQYVRQRFVGHT